MFATSTLTFLLALASPLLVRADVTPTLPSPGDSFTVGSPCTVAWSGDKASTTIWKGMAIELMTGDNFDMVHLTTVATNQDGTVDGRFQFTCPDVTPYSAIYFYQFTSPQTTNATWTGRFTIVSSTGASTPPSNANQPDGSAIPWGTGALVDPSKAVPAPSFAVDSSSNTTASSSSLSGSASATKALSSTMVKLSSSSSSSSSPSSSAAHASSTAASNGVAGTVIVDSRVWAAMVSLGASAMAFMLLL